MTEHDDDIILEGWKEIGREWGLRGVSVDTIRRKARKFKMPYLRWGDKPNAPVWILKSNLLTWWAKVQKNTLNSRKNT